MKKKKIHKGENKNWLRTIETKCKWLTAEVKQLKWVKQQLLMILLECIALLMKTLISLCEMKERSELKVKQVFNTLMKTGERLTHLMQLMPHQKHKLTDKYLHILCHWEGDYSQFKKKLRKWKKFLNYQQRKEVNERTEIQLKEQQSTETIIQVNLWKNYQVYQ